LLTSSRLAHVGLQEIRHPPRNIPRFFGNRIGEHTQPRHRDRFATGTRSAPPKEIVTAIPARLSYVAAAIASILTHHLAAHPASVSPPAPRPELPILFSALRI
jgi:hypothetical protein